MATTIKQRELDYVIRVLHRLIPKVEDCEDIAIEIVTASWLANLRRPSRKYIKYRAIDFLRKCEAEKRNETLYGLRAARKEVVYPSETKKVQQEDLLSSLKSTLTREEKAAIWYYYYLELNMRETANRMNKSLATVSRLINSGIHKMSDTYKHYEENNNGSS